MVAVATSGLPEDSLSPDASGLACCAGAGGRGRIRTSVARKERQIYSLLVLTTHPPVPRGRTTTHIGLVSADTNPFVFLREEPGFRNLNDAPFQSQLAEEFEPTTL